ncbi:MAG: sigma-70 family RNA polymerase sigma factor [Bacteroidota bacterium]
MGNEKTTLAIRKNHIVKRLYQKYYHALMAFALGLTKNESDADDLVALIFEKLCNLPLEKLEALEEWDAPSTYNYLLKALRNLYIDLQRGKKNRSAREQNYFDKNYSKPSHSPESVFLEKEKLQTVKKAYFDALDEQPKILKVAFYLKIDRDFRSKDVARLIGMNPNTFGVQYLRFKKRVKEKLAKPSHSC